MTTSADVVTDIQLHELLHRCKQRRGLSYQELDKLALVCDELTALRRQLREAVPALEDGSERMSVAASYASAGGDQELFVTYRNQADQLRSLASLAKEGV